jgi:hypothetical protein
VRFQSATALCFRIAIKRAEALLTLTRISFAFLTFRMRKNPNMPIGRSTATTVVGSTNKTTPSSQKFKNVTSC